MAEVLNQIPAPRLIQNAEVLASLPDPGEQGPLKLSRLMHYDRAPDFMTPGRIKENRPTGTLPDEAKHLSCLAASGLSADENPPAHFAVLILAIDETPHAAMPIPVMFS
jgi:hypothetical protein